MPTHSISEEIYGTGVDGDGTDPAPLTRDMFYENLKAWYRV